MKTKKILWLLCVLTVGNFTNILAHAEEKIEVEVYPHHRYIINGIKDIQGIFGMAVNGESKDQMLEETRALNLNSLRLYLWPIEYPPLSLSHNAVKGIYEDKEFSKKLSDSFEGAIKNKAAQAYQLELCRKWEVKDKLVIHLGGAGGQAETPFPDAKDWSVYFIESLKLIKKHYPELNVEYVQIWNEPDYMTKLYSNTDELVKAYLNLHNITAEEVQKVFPKIKIIGPCLWGFVGNWYHWRKWVVPFLKEAKGGEYFNFHEYDRSAEEILTWLEMLQAEAIKLRGKFMPGIVTETNLVFRNQEEWISDRMQWKRVNWLADHLFTYLDHPEKIAINTYFLFYYKPLEDHALFKEDETGQLRPLPSYWLYWVLRDLRGKRIYNTPVVGSKELRVVSALNNNDLIIGLFNKDNNPKQLRFRVVSDGENIPQLKEINYIRYNELTQQVEYGNIEPKLLEKQDRSNIELAIPAQSIYSMKLCFQRPLIQGKELAEEEYFAQDTAVDFPAHKTIIIKPARVPGKQESVRLRIGISFDGLLLEDKVKFSFNGIRYEEPVVFSNIVSPDINPAACLIEVPINVQQIHEENKVQFLNEKDNYLIMFTSLVFQEHPNVELATRFSTFVQEEDKCSLEVEFPFVVTPGIYDLKLSFQSKTDHFIDLIPEIKLPEGWQLRTKADKIRLPPNKDVIQLFHIEVPEESKRGKKEIGVSLSSLDGVISLKSKRECNYYPKIVATKMSFPPIIDGSLKEWKSKSSCQWKSGLISDNTTVKSDIKMGWDDKNFYMAVEIEVPEVLASNADNYWAKDSVELFCDFGNEKEKRYDKNDLQLYFAPIHESHRKPHWGKVIRDLEGNVKGIDKETPFKVIAHVKSKSYIIEAAIPWESLGSYRPKSGDCIGFDITMTHGLSVQTSLLDGYPKKYAEPSEWSLLFFGPPAD